MTVSTVKSVNITNIEAAPIATLIGKAASKKVAIDKIEVATTSIDEVGDIILMAPIPSNAKILSIQILNDDLDSNATPTLAADVGLYYSGKNNVVAGVAKASGVVVDADCFATAITNLQAAAVVPGEVRFERGAGTVGDIVDIVKEAWEVGGLTADCGGLLYIGLTITAVSATAAAGSIVMIVNYI